MDIGRLNPGARVSLFGRSEILPTSKYGLIPGVQYPASSVSEIYDYGMRTNGQYSIYVNGVVRDIYCDLTGTYTGDSTRGYMLYQTFGTANPLTGGISTMNITSSNYSSAGWSVYTDGSWYNNADNLCGWYGNAPVGYLRLDSLGFSTPTISGVSVKWGNGHSAGTSRLYINGSLVQTSGAGGTYTWYGSISAYTGSNIIYVDEPDTSIWKIHHIFVR